MKAITRFRESLQAFVKRRAQVVGINRRNVELVYAHNERTDYPLADDKLLTKIRLKEVGIPTPEVLEVCEALHEVPACVERLRGKSHFVVKPTQGSGGDGILVVGEALPEGGWRRGESGILSEESLFRHFADIVFGAFGDDLEDRAFVEKKVVADAVLSGLFSDGLSDIRVITLEGRPIRAMLRIPSKSSGGRANLHQGGVGAAIRMEDGEIFRALCKGVPVTHHPDTGATLLGVQIPRWEEVLDTAVRTAKAFPLGFLGIDIVIDETRGPLVLEINARPGLEIQNVHGLGLAASLELSP